MPPHRLLTIGHSYALAANRRLAHVMGEAGRGRWAVTCAAPAYFRGKHDIRPAELQVGPDEPCPVRPLREYLTGRVHAFFYGRELAGLLRDNWDLVHCWEEPYVVAGGQVARWTPVDTRFVFRSAQSLPKKYPPPFGTIERQVVARADGWVCSGETVEANLLARPGYAAKPHARIPLGVDTGWFRPDPAAGAAVRRHLGWDDSVPVVGYLGRFVADKGLPLLMNVLPRLPDPWRAVFVGGGPMEPALRAWAAARPDRVRVVTDVPHDDAQNYVNAMTVLASPSQSTPNWKEQFGRMLIEAFACKVPVVGSDSGEIPFVLSGGAGVVVPEADEAAWVAALADVLSNPGRRAALAAAAFEKVHSHYTWDLVARNHVAFFDEVLARRRAAA